MIKNFIKKLDQTILFNFVKKIKNKFDDLKNFTTHERFVKKISKKTDLKHVTILDNDKKNDLSKLCEHHGSDKGYINFHRENLWPWNPHTYTNVYDNLFNHCRESVKLVFECGIGTTNERISCNMSSGGKPGASLKVWKDYFSNAEIFGADIDKSILFSENRIKTFYVDQLDNNKIHNFFKASFDKLKKGGIYIIEDVSSSYFEKLFDSLKKFSPEGIVLFDKNQFWYGNNLIIIRKK